MASRGKVLVVDDDANMRETISDNLEVAGFEVTEAESGAKAISAVTKDFFDVILMDYQLTDSTGIDVIRQIRRLNGESQIVMFTAHANLDTAVKAIQESVSDFLSKPIDFERLMHAINNAILKLRLEQENRRLMADLKKANEQLTELSQMKSKFMSMASHDLSNSLMTVQVSLDLLSGALKLEGENQKRLNYIATGIRQIARLTSDLVDWASMEQGKFRLEPTLFSPAALVEEVFLGQQARAQARGLTLTSQVESNLPKVHGDHRRLAQVLNNLLENAIRHTSKGGTIAVSVQTKGESVQWAVKDSGEGIAPQEINKIFQSFYQGSSDRQSAGRLGLGLSIAKEIIEAHKGRLWVESPGLGKGATFLFTVPAAA